MQIEVTPSGFTLQVSQDEMSSLIAACLYVDGQATTAKARKNKDIIDNKNLLDQFNDFGKAKTGKALI